MQLFRPIKSTQRQTKVQTIHTHLFTLPTKLPAYSPFPISLPLAFLAFLMLLGLYGSQAQAAYTCNSDCYAEARFTYRCPTVRNPGRKCSGRNPAKFAACQSAKTVSCKLWNSIVKKIEPMAKSKMSHRFNASSYAAAAENGEMEQYMVLCGAAMALTCAEIGSILGGAPGAILGGAGGAFIAFQLCRQSAKW